MASTLAFSTFDDKDNSLAKSIKKNKTLKRKSKK